MRLANTKECADALRVHPGTIRRWLKEGRIPKEHVTKFGNHWRFDVEAIGRYMLGKEKV